MPILIGMFALFPHRAVRTNLLISLATLAMSAVARLSFVHTNSVADFGVEIAGMLVGGIIAAWLGAAALSLGQVATVTFIERPPLPSLITTVPI